MLLIQTKVSKKGGILVIDATGEMHPCLEPDELWDALTELGAAQPKGEVQPVPDALLIQVKVRRNGMVIIDPLAEMHHCTDAHDLWETVADLIESKDMLKATTTAAFAAQGAAFAAQGAALAVQDHDELKLHEDVQVIIDEEEARPHNPNEVREVIEEMVGDAAAELGAGLFKRLRGLSHRGAAPKPGSRASRGRVKRGDIY